MTLAERAEEQQLLGQWIAEELRRAQAERQYYKQLAKEEAAKTIALKASFSASNSDTEEACDMIRKGIAYPHFAEVAFQVKPLSLHSKSALAQDNLSRSWSSPQRCLIKISAILRDAKACFQECAR